MSFTQEQREIINQAIEAQRVPGVAVAIVKDGNIVAAEGFGLRDLDAKLPMTENTVTPICSLTKSMTGVNIMRLVEEGKISLDEPIQSYLPTFRVADEDASRKITPRVLLSHKSGMGRTGHQPRMFDDLKSSPYNDRADLVSRLADVQLQTAPNVAWSYCNEGFATLGHLVETMRDEPLESCFSQYVFDPSGMSNTHTSFSEWRKSQDSARLYSRIDDSYEEAKLPEDYSIYLSTGGICSTVTDIAAYQIATMEYANSPLLKAGSFDQMQSISMPFGDTGWGYGLGWWVRWSGSTKIVLHSGGLPGVATYSLMVPSKKFGVVVFANLGGARVDLLAERLANSELGEPLYRTSIDDPMPFTTRYRLADGEIEGFAGDYSIGVDSNVSVTVNAEPLRISEYSSDNPRDEDTQDGVLVGPNTVMTLQRASLISFVRDESGKVSSLLSGGEQYPKQR